jgi:Collagen triple helix repeat (20 copies)
MFQALRKHLTPGTFIALLALVFALTGGAFAATGGGGSPAKATASVTPGSAVASVAKSKAKPKTKAGLRGPAGPQGATGATGPAGPAGPAGAAGGKGENGAAGNNGNNGAEGKAGESVTLGTAKTGTKKGECKEGGATVSNASGSVPVCNGEKGVIHPGETLPAGATETGTWELMNVPVKEFEVAGWGAVSFPIPLSKPLESTGPGSEAPEKIIGVEQGEGEKNQSSAIPGDCKGTVENPGAAPGHLCVFESSAEDVLGIETFNFGQKAPEGYSVGRTGAGFRVISEKAGTVNVHGTWAVTE